MALYRHNPCERGSKKLVLLSFCYRFGGTEGKTLDTHKILNFAKRFALSFRLRSKLNVK